MKQWLFQRALPELNTLSKVASRIDPPKLTKEELVFLMMAYQQIEYDEDWLPDNVEPFDFDFLWPFIANSKNEHYPINLDDVFLSRPQGWFNLSSMSSTIEELDQYAFAMQHTDPVFGNIQIILNRTGKHYIVKIACKSSN